MFPRQKSKDQEENEVVGVSEMVSRKPKNEIILRKRITQQYSRKKEDQEIKRGKYCKVMIRLSNSETPNRKGMG